MTPSRKPPAVRDAIVAAAADAARALGLREGPVHAEFRLSRAGPVALEVAARTIGGLCGRALRFAGGASLEEVVLRHALGLSAGPRPARGGRLGRDDDPDPSRRRARGGARALRGAGGSRGRGRRDLGASRRSDWCRCRRARATSGSCSRAPMIPPRSRPRCGARTPRSSFGSPPGRTDAAVAAGVRGAREADDGVGDPRGSADPILIETDRDEHWGSFGSRRGRVKADSRGGNRATRDVYVGSR